MEPSLFFVEALDICQSDRAPLCKCFLETALVSYPVDGSVLQAFCLVKRIEFFFPQVEFEVEGECFQGLVYAHHRAGMKVEVVGLF